MLADYSTIGLTTRAHPLALLRERMAQDVVTSRDLESLEHGRRVRIGGLVVARQRPGTASGVVFILLEDEFGTINLIVPPPVYERHRLIVRTEPLMLVEGKLERFAAAGGAINVLVDRVGQIDAPDTVARRDQGLLDARRAGPAGPGRAAGQAAGEGGQAAAEAGQGARWPGRPRTSGRSRRRS